MATLVPGKTGVWGKRVLLDLDPCILKPLAALKSSLASDALLCDLTPADLKARSDGAALLLGLSPLRPSLHHLRHGGASEDLALQRRPLAAVQRGPLAERGLTSPLQHGVEAAGDPQPCAPGGGSVRPVGGSQPGGRLAARAAGPAEPDLARARRVGAVGRGGAGAAARRRRPRGQAPAALTASDAEVARHLHRRLGVEVKRPDKGRRVLGYRCSLELIGGCGSLSQAAHRLGGAASFLDWGHGAMEDHLKRSPSPGGKRLDFFECFIRRVLGDSLQFVAKGGSHHPPHISRAYGGAGPLCLSAERQRKVDIGSASFRFTITIIRLCRRCRAPVRVESPRVNHLVRDAADLPPPRRGRSDPQLPSLCLLYPVEEGDDGGEMGGWLLRRLGTPVRGPWGICGHTGRPHVILQGRDLGAPAKRAALSAAYPKKLRAALAKNFASVVQKLETARRFRKAWELTANGQITTREVADGVASLPPARWCPSCQWSFRFRHCCIVFIENGEPQPPVIPWSLVRGLSRRVPIFFNRSCPASGAAAGVPRILMYKPKEKGMDAEAQRSAQASRPACPVIQLLSSGGWRPDLQHAGVLLASGRSDSAIAALSL
ncbi:unnamed protein product [Prorocentrum cordatum]|uniref:Uncharacterized protein n=1 Tax=Prorocentrum cordatum TaxID=2364126 RepID=A0ABN9XF22_9DINO|nr:unnamed protein product [Polarella glacialis]